MWVRVGIKVSERHVLEYIEEKEGEREVAVESYSCENPMYAYPKRI